MYRKQLHILYIECNLPRASFDLDHVVIVGLGRTNAYVDLHSRRGRLLA